MNVSFKVYWNNPIDMVTEAEPQQLTFEVPLGAIMVAITKETVTDALGYTPAPTRKTVNTQSVSYQLQLSDANNIVRTTGATATNITVPDAGTVAWTPQDRVEVEWYGAGQPTIVAGSGVTIQVAGGSLALTQQYSRVTLEYVGSDEWIMFK